MLLVSLKRVVMPCIHFQTCQIVSSHDVIKKVAVFWYVIPCSLVDITDISHKSTVSIPCSLKPTTLNMEAFFFFF